MGSDTRRYLDSRGDHVTVLVRYKTSVSDEIAWDPASGFLNPAVVSGFDAVINFSGAEISVKTASCIPVVLASMYQI